jgi:hypothetical protein
MLNEHNTFTIAQNMDDLLDTPVSENLVKLIPIEKRRTYVRQSYLWTIGKIKDEEFKDITRQLLDEAKLKVKKYEPKNELEKLFLAQKLKN